MNHSICSLLHWLAAQPKPLGEHHITNHDFVLQVDRCVGNRYMVRVEKDHVPNEVWVKLTQKGYEMALESLNLLESIS